MWANRTVALGLAAAAVAGCGKAGMPAAGVAPVGSPVGGPARTATGAVDANLAYWNGLNSVPGQMAEHAKDGPDAQVWAFRRAAGVIRQNPTLGIDADLVAWALRMADLLEHRATLTQQSRNPAVLVEAFARGWGGDPFGVPLEMNQAERTWAAAMQAHRQDWNRLRAALTARHGVQFP